MSEPMVHTVATAVVALVCALFSWPMYFANRKVPGTLYWALAVSTIPLALASLSTQPFAPAWLGIVFANHLFLLYGLLLAYGTWLFFGKRPNLHLLAAIATAFSLPFLYFTYIRPDVDARIVLVSTMLILTSVIMFSTVVTRKKGEFTIGAMLIYAVLGATTALMLYRIVYVLFVGQMGNIFNNTTINVLVAGIAYFSSYGLTLSFYMLCHEKQLQQIKQLQQDAEEQTAQKSRFLAFLSHELRTPLNAIVGKAQLIAQDTTSEQIRYDCGLIVDAGMALSSMAKQILEHSRLEHGNVSIELAEVQLSDWLSRIVDTYKPMANEKHLQLQLELAAEHELSFRFDQGKIRQVLTNLLSNAIKYSDAGIVLLKAVVAPNQHAISFHVMDQGIGISEAEQHNVLQPFSRAGNSKNREGSGLGLALSQRILQRLGSGLQFSSTLGQGSHFFFELAVEPLPQLSPTPEVKAVAPLSILLVEDVALNQQIIMAMLELDQHQVCCVDSIALALAFSSLHKVDLILLDMNLADGDGLAFYQQLCQKQGQAPLTVMLTADVSEPLKQRCLNAGITEVLHKPLTLQSLRQCLSRVTSAGATARTLRLYANAATFMQIARYLPAAAVKDKVDRLKHELADAITELQATMTDATECQKQLHRLASIAASLGLEILADSCRALEQQQHSMTQTTLNLISVLMEHSVEQLKTKVQ